MLHKFILSFIQQIFTEDQLCLSHNVRYWLHHRTHNEKHRHCPTHGFNDLKLIILTDLYKSPKVSIICLFYKWRNWGSTKLYNLSKMTQLWNNGMNIKAQVKLILMSCTVVIKNLSSGVKQTDLNPSSATNDCASLSKLLNLCKSRFPH